jgi:transcriptional regulator with PAS, ATPase and Fis domain
VEVNCTAIPETLLESELFGHEAGAFTDAKTSKAGLFEAANGGSIFLDEIGDMGPAVQAKLLQVLESKEVRRIGATSTQRVNVRVIAATNQPLEALLRERKFREDLYFRLKVFPIQLPPLRSYLSDVILLAQRFIQEFNREFHKEIQGLNFTTEKKLREYDYPGNVRELRNIIERAVILESGKFLSAENIALFGVPEKEGKTEEMELPGDLELLTMEKRMIEEALMRTSRNQSEAAKLLKITRFALRNRMKKFGLM